MFLDGSGLIDKWIKWRRLNQEWRKIILLQQNWFQTYDFIATIGQMSLLSLSFGRLMY